MRKKTKHFMLQCLIVCLVGFGLGIAGYWWSQGDFPGLRSSLPVEEIGLPEVFQPGEGEYADYCPLCGLAVTASFAPHPLAIIIDNTRKGLPQSGLLEADIIYETPIEGGLTRLMAVYYHTQPGKIGPIRSLRPYFLDIAEEYTAIPVHCGGSPAAAQRINQQGIITVNAEKKKAAFWQSSQAKAPYNLYSSYEYLSQDLSPASPGKIDALSAGGFYLPEKGPLEDVLGASVGINFSADQKINYVYEAEKSVYTRLVGGKPHLDADSGQPLTPANVIIQMVSSKVIDQVGRLELGTTGSGPAYVYTQGKKIAATWSRAAFEQKTVFHDPKGELIPLTPGQTWIELVPSGVQIE